MPEVSYTEDQIRSGMRLVRGLASLTLDDEVNEEGEPFIMENDACYSWLTDAVNEARNVLGCEDWSFRI